MKPLSWGAESNLYLVEYLGRKAVLKKRLYKPYMHLSLAAKLVYKRTLAEAKILYEANSIGIPSPFPLKIEPRSGVLVISYISGVLFKKMIDSRGADDMTRKLMSKLGGYVGKLHNHGIIHSDLTTSNLIYNSRSKVLYLIDYGLAFKSGRVEDKAMDIRVLERSLESTHPRHYPSLMSAFTEGYSSVAVDYEKVFEKLDQIRGRGRYVRRDGR